MSLQNAAFEASALDVKTKELISVGIAAYNRCKYCIVVHVYNAIQAGATRQGNSGRCKVAAAASARAPAWRIPPLICWQQSTNLNTISTSNGSNAGKNLQLWMSWRFCIAGELLCHTVGKKGVENDGYDRSGIWEIGQ